MKRYVLANIKIPVVINENGLFDMLNEYTQTEITSLNALPTIEEEDNLYKKIMEFLNTEQMIKHYRSDGAPFDNKHSQSQETGESSCESELEILESDGHKNAPEQLQQTTEQIITICKNNIKMRKRSDNMSFKNIKKGAKSYTRKSYTDI